MVRAAGIKRPPPKRKKLETVQKIKVNNSRNITYHKRIRGILKKAVEISILCE
jgi:hypothetical protein